MPTYTPKRSDIQREWHLIDAEGAILGRLATEVATLLRGKHKPTFAPHMDTGDYVIVVNAQALAVSARKGHDKLYHRHTGLPGRHQDREPRDAARRATPSASCASRCRRMLPKGPLGRKMLKKLKIHPGPTHPHAAQQPKARPLPARSLARTSA